MVVVDAELVTVEEITENVVADETRCFPEVRAWARAVHFVLLEVLNH